MENSNKDGFLACFAQIAARYPNTQLTAAHGASYWNALVNFSLTSVAGAFERAMKESPIFFPTAPAVAAHAKVIDGQEKNPTPPQRPMLTGAVGARLDENNPFEKLARTWIEESRLGGWLGECPREVGKRRMRELNELLSANPIGAMP